MKRATNLAAAALFCAALAGAQQPPATAAMDQAKAAAKGSQRVVLAIFHASWCGWCKKFDSFLDSTDVGPIAEKYFVRAYVTVQEREEKVALNTPGGEELLVSLGGPKDSGLPFFAFVDSGGGLIVNSMRPGENGKFENIGHPVQPEEVDWFMIMLAKAVPAMTPDEAATLEKYLRNQKK
jgi:thiol-disulfide isomerase/thioredoxin